MKAAFNGREAEKLLGFRLGNHACIKGQALNMKDFLKSTPLALVICAALVLLAGCNGSQAGAPGTMPQNAASGAHLTHAGSWMKPGASGSDLLYIGSANAVYVFTYPGGKPVGTLTGFDDPVGLCSDAKGNVWITNADNSNGNGYLLEYAHGGTSPIATLADPKNEPVACSIDPTTGNLAVASVWEDIAIYPDAQGSPTHYPTVEEDQTITYDASGNVYSGSFRNANWLPAGSGKVMPFSCTKPRPLGRGSFQWDGTRLAVIGTKSHQGVRHVMMYRYEVSGSRGINGSIVHLNAPAPGPFWIQGSGLILSDYANVYFFNYPAGGNPTYTISGLVASGVTVSVAPPGSRIRK
jgi:hypothetical protein